MLMTLICDPWPFLFCCGFRKDEMKSFWALPLKQTTNVTQFDTKILFFPRFSRKISEMFEKIWMFPKIMVPQNHPNFSRVFHYNPSILGFSPYFWKHPYGKNFHHQLNWFNLFEAGPTLELMPEWKSGGLMVVWMGMDGVGTQQTHLGTWFLVLKPCK